MVTCLIRGLVRARFVFDYSTTNRVLGVVKPCHKGVVVLR
jgi:hypothetical protein